MKRILVALFVILLMFNVAAACDPDIDCDTIIVDVIDTSKDVEEYNGSD